MAYSSPTTINASKGLLEIATYLNNVTDNWVSNLLLLAIYVIVLIGFNKARNDFKGAMAVAGYTTFVISLLLWIGGFISGVAFGMVIAIAVIGTLIILLD